MRFKRRSVSGGFILADAGVAPEPEWFEPNHWRGQGGGEPLGGGRGVAVSVGPRGSWVLRHYHRGGLPGRWVDDRYLWLGERRTRPVGELRVLSALAQAGAPVPRPIAVRVLRHGLFYRGDLITERIESASTLAAAAGNLSHAAWGMVGRAIRRFHDAGGWHADLNAHNVLLSPSGVFIVDLDRGRLVRPGVGAQRRNLRRLERSLRKLGHLPAAQAGWAALLAAYAVPD